MSLCFFNLLFNPFIILILLSPPMNLFFKFDDLVKVIPCIVT